VKIGLHFYYKPYFGGGERYLLTAAEALRSLGEVDFICRFPVDLAPLAEHFALDLTGVRAVHRPQRFAHGWRDWLTPPAYDFFLALDNHLEPVQVSLGKRGVLHLQSPPYRPERSHPFRGRLRLRGYDAIVCNSEYTRRWAERHGTAGVPARVVYPPIDVDLYRPLAKKPMILSVGRFFVGRHEKKHDVMIDAFRELRRRGLEGWELHFVGSLRRHQPEALHYLDDLRKRAHDLPVVFHVDAPIEEARRLYGESSLYWHATGHGVDEEATPQFLEHFGMSIVEAMAAGAVPIVVGKGGPLEIVRDGETGFFWATPEDLVRRTLEAARAPEDAAAAWRRRGRDDARRFAKVRFAAEMSALVREFC